VNDVAAELLARLRPELVAGEDADLIARLQRPWWPRAACRTQPVELFFPTSGQSRLADAARAVCARCSAREDCLDWALSWGPDLQGVWGGTVHSERVELLRRRGPGK
jgi:WhiB family redox-sensing transcriptional regulator